MPQEITARELLKLVLDDEEFNSGKGPRSIVGFDSLLEKMDKLCDAITQRESNGEGYEGGHSEEMKALVANLEAIKELLDKPAVELPDNSDMQTLLSTIAKNTMRRQRPWEFDIQRDRRTGFTEKIIARPVGE
jgi:hypothetical protein